jgi:hypothetical protein
MYSPNQRCQLTETSAAKDKSGRIQISVARKICGQIFANLSKHGRKVAELFEVCSYIPILATILRKTSSLEKCVRRNFSPNCSVDLAQIICQELATLPQAGCLMAALILYLI